MAPKSEFDEAALDAAMDRYACGDRRAFDELFEALSSRLLSYLTRMTNSEAAARDLVQETFLRLHRARGTFAPGGAVLPWAYAIARNAYLDWMRAARHRTTERLPSDPAFEPSDGRHEDGESVAMAEETARTVRETLAALPPAQREAFVLIRYEGFSLEHAARIAGTTPSAMKLRAFRAYEAIRRALARVSTPGEGQDAMQATLGRRAGGSA